MQSGIKVAQKNPESFTDGLGIVARKIAGPSGLPAGSDPVVIIQKAFTFLSGLIAIISIGVFIWGAFRYMTSLGDEAKAASAKKVMMYAIIGLGIALSAFIIITIVRTALGI